MANHRLTSRVARIVAQTLRRGRGQETARLAKAPASRSVAAPPPADQASGATYPGDFQGTPEISYAPDAGNGKVADPGEIAWTWVPFEEDHSQGKDRPVLVIGRDGRWLLALGLTSKDHDRDAAREARAGRQWTDLGTGPWDPRRRASEVRVDRILRVDPAAVRREGAILDEKRFNQIADAVRSSRGRR